MVYRLKEDCVLITFGRKPNEDISPAQLWHLKGTYLISAGDIVPGSNLALLLTPTGTLVFTSKDRLEIVP